MTVSLLTVISWLLALYIYTYFYIIFIRLAALSCRLFLIGHIGVRIYLSFVSIAKITKILLTTYKYNNNLTNIYLTLCG